MPVVTNVDPVAKIKVVGVGGGGNNAINTMISEYGIEGVEFMSFNTDAQSLKNSLAPITLQMGVELTRGLGVGGDHQLGSQAADESVDEITDNLAGADMVFVTAGMGGGTGTGAAPIVAGIAKNLGALTVGVVTKPFDFEGRHRVELAEQGIAELRDKVDTLIIVPNQRLLEIIDEDISFIDAMKKVDNVLAEGVKSIAGLITRSGFINVDFADIRSIMMDAGSSLMGIGKASGENRAEVAARMATNSPLLDLSIEGAKGVLFNVLGGLDLSMREVDLAAQLIQEAVDPEANIIFGASIDENLEDEIVITIIATGFDEANQVYTKPSPAVQQQVEERNMDELQSFDFDGNTKEEVSRIADEDEKYEQPVQGKSQEDSREEDTKISLDDFEDDLDVPAFLRNKK
jgi:cell division protein FtsZ